jgi:tRNA-modifying protein YgfZ
MKAALLDDRGVIKVAGEAARSFLNGIVTTDVTKVAPGRPCFAGLLTPQGKIIADFIVVAAPDGDGVMLDMPRALVKAVLQKLNFYRLRAQVSCEDRSERLGVLAVWENAGTTTRGLVYPDPRIPALGHRVILPPHLAAEAAAELGAELVETEAYDAHRIALGIPSGGADFSYGEAFPHDAVMDQLAGIDFTKGCYVGQEVVARMEHRGLARNRIVPLACEGGAPQTGTTVSAGDKSIGTLGSAADGRALALVRLDRVADALAAGTPLAAGGHAVRLVKPDWVLFKWPGEGNRRSEDGTPRAALP